LRELGWIENQSLLIEWRFSEGSAAPLARLATELVEKNVEVIVTTPTQPTIAAKHATSTIPIVFVGVADPLLSGIVTNLARPDANVTGLSTLSTDLAGKQLALLKEALPGLKRISILWNRPSKGSAQVFEEMRAACKSLDIEPHDIGVSEAAEFDRALDVAVSNKSAAVHAHSQSKSGKKPGYRNSPGARCSRRRGDRIAFLFAALHESALGPKQT
jgi:ABC-type uncharacterized transport system substrate-binding protein